MSISIWRTALSIMLALGLLAACGDAPARVSSSQLARERSATLGEAGQLPADHPSTGEPVHGAAGAVASALAGQVDLSGALAGLESGAIYLVGWEKSSGSPLLVGKLTVAELDRSDAGHARGAFTIEHTHTSSTGEIAELELEVRIDLDGDVDTKEDVVARVRVPVQLGDQSVHVDMDDGARTEAALPGE